MSDHEYILEKARRYCSYQERCIYDMKQKLYEWNVQPAIQDKIINQLELEDVLNEERFARSFAIGRFRMKKWGKNKIMAELHRRKVPDLYIQIGLQEIDEEDYKMMLREMITKKAATIDESDTFKLKNKLARFAISKGYRSGLVWDIIQSEL